MNSIFKDDKIQELICGSNFAYVLSKDAQLLSTEYKVLQSQEDGGFLRCMKMSYNGKIKLFYKTEGLRNLSSMLASLDADNFMTIVANLFHEIIEVKNNGFLNCQNIDISFDKIFVNPNNLKVKLTYVPVNRIAFLDYSIFENELRTSLIKIINSLSNLNANKVIQFSTYLSDGTLTLEDLYNKMKGIKSNSTSVKPVEPTTSSNELRIVAMNAPTRIEIKVDKDTYVIGKNPNMVDGAVTFNSAISRRHCQIVKENGQYYIMDLGSANGTFVNKRKLMPNESCLIQNGDIIRLANTDFQVYVG